MASAVEMEWLLHFYMDMRELSFYPRTVGCGLVVQLVSKIDAFVFECLQESAGVSS